MTSIRRRVWAIATLGILVFNIIISLAERDRLPFQPAPNPDPQETIGVLVHRDLEGHAFIWLLAGLITVLGGRNQRTRIMMASGILLLSGLVEIAQETLTQTRNGQWIDFGANTLGIGVALIVIEGVLRITARRQLSPRDLTTSHHGL